MDTTKEYIKMCEKAEDIQQLWKQSIGDYDVEPDDYTVCMITVLSEKAFGTRDKNSIWLPRQEQLQELVDNIDITISKSETKQWCWWIAEDEMGPTKIEFFDTLEKLWITYVMFNLFSKIWTGRNWIIGKK